MGIRRYDDGLDLTRDTLGVALAYDDANRRTSLTLPNGIVTEYGYDDANELTSLTYLNGQTTLGDLTYTYDLAGQQVAIGGSWARTLLPQPVASASYDAANELTAWGGQAMAYDPIGNTTFDGTLVYGWNARNQLTSLAGGTTAGFTYDATGRRTAKTIDGTTTTFLYDGVDAVQTDVGGHVNARLLGAAIDEWFASIGPGGVEVPLVDALGSSLALADGAGAPQTSYTFGAFGATSASGASSDNPWRFTGRESDEPRLYYYRARYYSPAYQRFLSEDPIGLAAGPNFYTYVSNSSPNLVDPSGACQCSIVVRCRSIHVLVTRVFGAQHCYFVVKGRDQNIVTLTGYPEDGRLRVADPPGDPTQANSLKDREVYRSVGQAQVCTDVECLKNKQRELDEMHLQYNPRSGPNSNTFVSWAARQCGLSVTLPPGTFGAGAQVP